MKRGKPTKSFNWFEIDASAKNYLNYYSALKNVDTRLMWTKEVLLSITESSVMKCNTIHLATIHTPA